MRLAVTLVSPSAEAASATADRAIEALAGQARIVKPPERLGPGAIDIAAEADALSGVRAAVLAAAQGAPVDVCVQPEALRRKRLLIADMDSTIIGCECLDELADYAGVKDRVAAITERAMRGELDFAAALTERVRMLSGLDQAVLLRCYAERVRLNAGARTLVRTMGEAGARCVLVSGGFDAFTSRVADAAGFHEQRANRLEIGPDGRLTGEVARPILGREAKLEALRTCAADLGAPLDAAVAIGDGANDLDMIRAAGLGVAYRAKPVVAAEAAARIDHADLTALLFFQGFRAAEFRSD